MDEQQIADHLFTVAVGLASQFGRRLGEGADADLRQMTHDAAVALRKIPDPNTRLTAINKAEIDVYRLVQMALEEANSLPNYPLDLLGEQTFLPAKIRFCPCPPLC
jgi:hypothetical protein